MRHSFSALISAGILAIIVSGCVSPDGATVGERQRAVQEMRAATLARLYDIHPSAREQIAKAEGYGVFSNVGINLIFLSAANGYGVVRDQKTGATAYMKMVSGGIGVGLGAKDFRGVFVFTSRSALKHFVEHGWDASAQADAAAKSGGKGGAAAGAVDVAPGIKLYQITETGLALQATIQGTKYWRDDDLS